MAEDLSGVFKAWGWVFITKGQQASLVNNVVSVSPYRDGILS